MIGRAKAERRSPQEAEGASNPARRLAGTTLSFVLGLSFCSNLLLLTVPLFMLQIYDRVLTSGSVETLVMLALLASVMIGGYGLLDWSVRRTFAALGLSLERLFMPLALRADLVSGGHRAAWALANLRAVLTGPRPAWFVELLWVPLFALIVFLVHPLLGLVSLVGILLLLAVTLLTDRRTEVVAGELEGAHDVSQAFRQAVLADRAAVLSAADGRDRLSHYERLEEGTLEARRALSAVQSLSVSAARSLRQLIQITLLGLGAWLALQEAISAGAIVASSILMARALAPIENSLASWRSVRRAWQAFQDLDALCTAPVGLVPPRAEADWRLEVDRLAHRPAGQAQWLLRNLSLSVGPGELLVVAGMVGSGKSSLLELLGGVRPPLVGGLRYLDSQGREGWPAIGYCGQDPVVYPGTLAQNVAGFGAPDPAACEAAIAAAGVGGLLAEAGLELDSEIAEPARLSRGQRQAIALARAFYHEPAVYILDEPTSALDARHELAVIQALGRARAGGALVVVATHSDRVAALATQLLLLHPEGRHELFSGAEELRSRLAARSGRRLTSEAGGEAGGGAATMPVPGE